MMLLEKFEVHQELNPKLWHNEKLRPEVRNKILEIVEEFKDYYETPLYIVDIQLCGSNCNYNYTATSDLDCHIIANFEAVSCDIEILQSLYNMEKSKFNSNFDISIHDIDVELYVQDVNSGITSNGIYSVVTDDWIKFPERLDNVPQYDLRNEISQWEEQILSVVRSGNYNDILDLINELYRIRSQSLLAEGEYGRGNQLFKELRAKGLLDKLKDKLNDCISKKLTLESINTLLLMDI